MWASLVTKTVRNLPATKETSIQSPGWEGTLEKGMVTHSCLESSIDREAWRATVHVVTKSWTQLRLTLLCIHVTDSLHYTVEISTTL